MKSEHLVVGKDYGYLSWVARGRHSLDNWKYAERVRVVATGVKEAKRRHTLSGTKTGTRTLVTVVSISDKGRRTGPEFNIEPRNIWRTWDEVAEQRNAINEARDNALRVREIASKNLRKTVPATLLPWWAKDKVYSDGSFSSGGHMSIADLEEIARAAYAKGREDALDGTEQVFITL